MMIREYRSTDEAGWVQCRLLSFLDCSYFDDVRKEKEIYEHPSVCYVAEDHGVIVGIIDVEYEEHAGDVCYLAGGLGAVIWHLGVLADYRRIGVADALWSRAKESLVNKGVTRFEVWTQDDAASNEWYIRQGFVYREAYLNAYIRGTANTDAITQYIQEDKAKDILGVRCFNFEAPLTQKEALQQICYRLHEVRLYEYSCRA